LIIGAAALACVVGIAVAVVVLPGGGGPSHGRLESSGAGQGSGAQSGLSTCAMPAKTASSRGWSLIATTKGAIPGYASPGGPQVSTIPASWYGEVSSLAVIAERAGWLEVRLATRPNGSTAWVHQADVAVTSTPYWISVDLMTRHLTLFRLKRQILSAPAGVGTAQDPTPMGQYFVAFFEASASSGYGPFIIVTSAHSTSIANWEGSGDAVIGIHGPLGANSLIGTTGAYLSHGCIRIPISDLVNLRDVPAGAPISICA
jgi:hypothetical protein